MLSLAPIKYRHVFATEGGPIDRVEFASYDHWGKQVTESNAFLKNDVYPGFRQQYPDGAGTHTSPLIARFMAISEAIERWALHAIVASNNADNYGFDVDITSNGMAAFPGLFDFQVRHKAFGEAIERHCLISWWEGLLPTKFLTLPYPQQQGLEINNPFSSHSVVILWEYCEQKYYAFSFGSGRNLQNAIWRASIELVRTQRYLQYYYQEHPHSTLDDIYEIEDMIEKRIVYFSTPQGYEKFLQRLNYPQKKSVPPPLKFLFDGKIDGPWNNYAQVWRIVLNPTTRKHLETTPDFFFW